MSKIFTQDKSLASKFPAITQQWHPTKNAGLTPVQVSWGARTIVWWKCDKGPDHEWEARVRQRTSQSQGCPFCAGKRTSVTNSLASLFKDIATQWHPTKNGDFTPDKIAAHSNKKVWWKCNEGPDHEWPNSPSERAQYRGCPFCAGKKVSVTNSLAARRPDLAAEWHPTRNGSLTPEQVTAKSNKYAWWKCSRDPTHKWRTKILNRSFYGCPACAEPGFDPSKSAILYYLRIDTETGPLYKIGITNFSVEERFIKGDFDKITILKTWAYEVGAEAQKREKEVLQKFRAQVYCGAPVLKSGNTEIFDFDILGLNAENPS